MEWRKARTRVAAQTGNLRAGRREKSEREIKLEVTVPSRRDPPSLKPPTSTFQRCLHGPAESGITEHRPAPTAGKVSANHTNDSLAHFSVEHKGIPVSCSETAKEEKPSGALERINQKKTTTKQIRLFLTLNRKYSVD